MKKIRQRMRKMSLLLAFALMLSMFSVFELPGTVKGDGIITAVSIGKSYTSTPTVTNVENYKDNTGAELTDGVKGVSAAKWNKNICAYDSDPTIVIDLGSVMQGLFRFEVRYMVIADHMGPIASATVSVSNDNVNWTPVGSLVVPARPKENVFQEAALELSKGVEGRYVKFSITKSDELVGFDEITVYAKTYDEIPADILITDNWDLLPDGRKFEFWDCETNFKKTYYVDVNNSNASDDNDGSAEKPFKTINKAASVAEPGDRILIKEGVYYETIRDVNGGTDPQHMIMFEGEGNVVITGAIEWNVQFKPSEGLREVMPHGERDLFTRDESKFYANNGAKVYMGKIPADAVAEADGVNPFSIINMPTIYFGGSDTPPNLIQEGSLNVFNPDPQLMKRGLLFCDGERMEQVVRPSELWEKDGTYWVDESGRYIHFRLKNDASPEGHKLELAMREQGFAPDESGLGYIYLKNLTFEKFSNSFPAPQRGAISTNCGHHFIIDGCTVKDVNSIGLDMGFISHYYLHDGIRGYHIVRNSKFINCGISGISALPTRGEYLKGMLIENNYFSGNCWHDTEPIWECAAIKNHYTEDSLYRNNIIVDTYYGAGIWLDKAIKNTRVCNNIIIGVEHSVFGGILIEATYDKNLVDHNFIYGTGYRITPLGVKTGGHGIYMNEVDNLGIYGNMIFNIVGDGVFTANTTTPRLIGTDNPKETTGSGNVIMHNIMDECKRAITLLTKHNVANENVIGDLSSATFLIQRESKQLSFDEARNELGFEKNGAKAKINVKFDRQTLSAEITVNGNTRTLDLNNRNAISDYMKELFKFLN